MFLIAGIGDQNPTARRSPTVPTAQRTAAGSSRRVVMQHRLRHLVDDVAAAVGLIRPGNADALAAGNQQLGERKGDDQPAFQLAVARIARGKAIEASGPARSTPCARLPTLLAAHRDDRRAPSAASRRGTPARPTRSGGIARNSRRSRRAPAVQAVDDVGGDAAGFKNEARQRSGERTAFAIGTSDCCDLLGLVLGCCGHQPIRVFTV
jgi:hypothetical protein